MLRSRKVSRPQDYESHVLTRSPFRDHLLSDPSVWDTLKPEVKLSRKGIKEAQMDVIKFVF